VTLGFLPCTGLGKGHLDDAAEARDVALAGAVVCGLRGRLGRLRIWGSKRDGRAQGKGWGSGNRQKEPRDS